jgi:integrase
MKVLGHSQIGLTMNTYAHVLPEIERAPLLMTPRGTCSADWLYGP